jgi:hypothetical protein
MRLLACLTCGSLLLGAVQISGAETPESGAESQQPVWVAFETLVLFRHLPRRYACEELRRKIHDVLVHVGAAPNVRVSPSRCEHASGGLNPRVRLRFELPQLAADRSRVPVRAVRRTVRLAAGSPRSLDTGDCTLMRQLNRQVFLVLPLEVRAYNLACLAGAPAEKYRIAIDVLMPVA